MRVLRVLAGVLGDGRRAGRERAEVRDVPGLDQQELRTLAEVLSAKVGHNSVN